MKITFPYMGCVTAYKRLLELMGHEVVMPEKPTQRTVDLGVLNSPEFICYPFKILMGTYIEACEKGVEVIVSSGGRGPCRAGMYGEVHKRILKQLGYDVHVIIFDSMFQNFKAFYKNLKLIKNKTPLIKLLKYVVFAYKMMLQMDKIDKEINIRRAYEVNRDDFKKCREKIVALYDGCSTLNDLRRAKKAAWALMDAVPQKKVPEKDKLRIGIVGEIYVAMESSTNMEMEKRLNALGAEVENIQYVSDWVTHNLFPKWMHLSRSWTLLDKGKRYKGCQCGGHDMENTGAIIDFAERGFDGVVHLMPFGCLPELITRSIVPQITEDLGIPVLSVSLDEQQGEANTQTRVEAFVDLCRSRKRSKDTELHIEPIAVLDNSKTEKQYEVGYKNA